MYYKKILLFLIVLVMAYLLVQGVYVYLQRSMYPLAYYEHIAKNAASYKVDPYLVAAVIKVESKFDPDAVSSQGARGLMQIMPATGVWAAEQLGLENFEEGMLFDPMINIQIGTWYLANLSREFDDKLPLVIAAYNGGRGTVNSWVKSGTWDGTYERREDIPYAETRAFLKKVLDNYEGYRNLYVKG